MVKTLGGADGQFYAHLYIGLGMRPMVTATRAWTSCAKPPANMRPTIIWATSPAFT